MNLLLLEHSFVNLDQLVCGKAEPGLLILTLSNGDKIKLKDKQAEQFMLEFQPLISESSIMLEEPHDKV